MKVNWHTLSVSRVLQDLHTTEHGLTDEEAQRRLIEYGLNVLPEKKPASLARIFFNQFQSPLIYVLLAASAVVFIGGEVIDGSIILAVLIFNAIVGTIQEGKAQNTLRALKSLVETQATVFRGGKEMIVPDREIVPGDILLLQEGEKIPADARIILSQNLTLDEASLTGESTPVHKTTNPLLHTELTIADQTNMLFKGTNVVAGNGKAVVVATALLTAIGTIAQQLTTTESEIPLKVNIRYLSRLILMVVATTGTTLFFAGIALGHTVKEMFSTVVALSVSIIPEGLPIVMTLVLATGVWRMSKQNALVKKMHAVEALGQAQIIAVDKTGTITKNEMVVQKVWTNEKLFDIGGLGYEPNGEIRLDDVVVDAANHEDVLFVGKLSSLSAGAHVSFVEEDKTWRVSGDPTEAAMLVFGEKVGFHKEDLLVESPLISELPFDYKEKYHALVHKDAPTTLLTVVGAPEAIMALCDYIRRDGKNHLLSRQDRDVLEHVHTQLSKNGLRVLAISTKSGVSGSLNKESIQGLTFVGFLGMRDTLRPEVAEAMSRAGAAGIRVVMITGDHKITAQAIATEAGIYRDGDAVLTGEEIEQYSFEELVEKLAHVSVFARVTPEHKVHIINAYKQRGEIVAMTGDGVNDAPSLVAADLGVAMGKIGTEVAKEAADIVLLDDNFSSIVSAVEEGRGIYKTIKKVILYLFSTSLGLVIVIAAALFLGYPLPILAAQIIWLNFVTDGFLDVSLAMEPKESGLLSSTFERPKKYIVDRLMALRIVLMALPMAIGSLYLFTQYVDADMGKAWTISLTVLAAFQWFNAWNCRSEQKSIFQMNPFSNLYLVGATVLVVGLQMLAVYAPLFQQFLRTVPLSLAEWLVIIPVAASILVVEEIRKLIYRTHLSRTT